MRRWRSPEELAEIGLLQSRVLMVNEAHDHLRRCIRTRRVGTRMIEPAHAAGARHLAMEALTPDFAAAANRDRCLGAGDGYLAQSDLRELMTAALGLGWSLIAYDPDAPVGNPHLLPTGNQRQAGQAHNLAAAFGRLPGGSKLMVWCGWSHHFKRSLRLTDGEIQLMGSRFRHAAGVTPFCIDQCLTVRLNAAHGHEPALVKRHRRALERVGGTAGFLVGFSGGRLPRMPWAGRGVDAVILSLHNEMQ